jgi:two-component system cell cycle sensor histidine kinase/response regulator CckA
VCFQDVTEARDTALRVAQTDRIDALNRLAGGVAHDFNNLITVMRGCVDMLQEDRAASDGSGEILTTLRSATDRATDLTRQLLGLRGQSRVETRIIDAVPFLEGLRGTLRQLAGPTIQVSLSLVDGPVLLRLDPTRLEHAILNLAANARDAMPDGGQLSIGLTAGAADARSRGGSAWLTVRDNGQGMDDESRARAFEPYFSTKSRGRGTGLGLSSVYGTVLDSGGDIGIESTPGFGTTVRIRLPRVEALA